MQWKATPPSKPILTLQCTMNILDSILVFRTSWNARMYYTNLIYKMQGGVILFHLIHLGSIQKGRKMLGMTTDIICKLYINVNVHWTWIVFINARRPCIHRFRKTQSTNIPISYDQYYFAMFKLHNITTKQSER